MTAADDIVTDPLLRSVLDSAAQARQQSLAILDLLDVLHASSDGASDSSLLEFSKQQKKLYSQLAQLRTLNRKAILGVRSTKQETGERRQEIDSLHLELQNLYYEQRHLKGEIGACEGYHHSYEDIKMLPREEFLELHPDHVETSKHDLTIARIKDEHESRMGLEEQRLQTVRRKEVLVKETAAKKEELAKLDAEMEKWVQGQESVRKMFEARDKKLEDSREKEMAGDGDEQMAG